MLMSVMAEESKGGGGRKLHFFGRQLQISNRREYRCLQFRLNASKFSKMGTFTPKFRTFRRHISDRLKFRGGQLLVILLIYRRDLYSAIWCIFESTD